MLGEALSIECSALAQQASQDADLLGKARSVHRKHYAHVYQAFARY
jgi:hypothetical protein